MRPIQPPRGLAHPCLSNKMRPRASSESQQTTCGEKRMRMMKLALATGFALLIGSGSAYAITVKKRIEAPGLPAEVWAVAGETFCTIKAWHPAVAACEETKDGDVTFRT